MYKLKYFAVFLLISHLNIQGTFAQFSVNENQRFLLKSGKPFFWLGDTAWELFHRLNREEADQYLKRRSEQGFTVVQAVVLAEMDGLHTPNAYGEKPLLNDDPTKPNEKYFQHVDFIVDKANQYNINIGMLPTWGDKIFKGTWGKGPEIFTEQNAAVYGTWLANRYKDKTNIIWILGGDRNPRNETDIAIWRAMGKAIKKATGNKAIISYHPQPNELGSAEWFHKDEWLDFNMFQTGHCRNEAVYEKIQAVYNMEPVKPVMDAEPIYEDHPVCVHPVSTPYPAEIITGFKNFCLKHGFEYNIISEIKTGYNTRKGEAYIVIEETDLANLIKNCRAQELAIGKDVGILSYNETPIKEMLVNGISVISTDHGRMGETAARMILEQRNGKIKNPFRLILRKSL